MRIVIYRQGAKIAKKIMNHEFKIFNLFSASFATQRKTRETIPALYDAVLFNGERIEGLVLFYPLERFPWSPVVQEQARARVRVPLAVTRQRPRRYS